MTRTGSPLLLSDVATAVARGAIAAPRLAATEIRVVAVPARVPLTRLRISTPDRIAAQAFAELLRLDDLRDSQHDTEDWTGYLTVAGLDLTARALRVDLILVDEPSTPTTTLLEASEVLALLDAAALHEIAVELVHLQPHDAVDDEIEIHTTYPRDARALSAELAALALPLRAVIRARPRTYSSRPTPPTCKDAP